jgi:hypothetical protein
MIEKRPNNKPVEAPSNTTVPPAAPAPLSVEERGVAALRDDALDATALAALVEQTTVALAEAEQAAAHERERAFDPTLTSNPKAAHAAMVEASFMADRLRTLLPRLQVRLAEVAVRERSLQWLAERDQFEAERCPPLVIARAAYESALEQMLDFFRLVDEFSAARSALLGRRPNECGLESVANPIPAPKMLSDTRLFDCSGAQLWPDPTQTNKLAATMAESVRGMMASQDPDLYTPNWWRAAQRRQAAARIEAERREESLTRMASEERERYLRDLAAHGAR